MSEKNTPFYARRRLVCGVGINDFEGSIKVDGKHIPSYTTWRNMVVRCYEVRYKTKSPTYKNCTLCADWIYYTRFKKWYDENFIDGFFIDKDLLVKGNKHYSPETCAFIPQVISNLTVKNDAIRGKYLIGVSYHKRDSLYRARLTIRGRGTILGYFKLEMDAFLRYKERKEAHIKVISQEYFEQGLIPLNIHQALMLYIVEETD